MKSHFGHLSPLALSQEGRILILCARPKLGQDHLAQLQELMRTGVDWLSLVKLAKIHGVTPRLYHSIKTNFSDLVPSSILDSLRIQVHGHTLLNQVLSKELLSLADAFSQKGIPVVPFKGPSLAICAYGDLSLREFVDLDLFIKSHDIPIARAILQSQGYKPTYKESEDETPEQLMARSYHTFVKGNRMISVDLQWKLAGPHFSFLLDRDVFWRDLQPFSFLNKEILSFAPEDLLIILCVHGSKHVWSELKWICDVAELVRSHPNMNWEKVIDRSSQLQCRRLVLIGLFLANWHFEVSIPNKIVELIASDSDISFLGKRVPLTLLADPREGIEEKHAFAFYLSLKDTVWKRLFFALHLCHAETPVFTDSLPWCRLQKYLRWLYFCIRPLHVFGASLGRKVGFNKLVSAWLQNIK